MAGITLGIREGVIGLIVVAALYMAVVAWRMRRLTRPPVTAAPDVEPALELPVEPAAEDTPEDGLTYARPPVAEPIVAYPRAQASVPAGADLAPAPVLAELALLRDEVAVLRAELAELRRDMQQEISVMRATQSVAPIYGDAMQLALAGYAPDVIAERCGIARAEAELVAALARSQTEGLK